MRQEQGSIRNALWVTDAAPAADGGGGNIRQAYLLRALAGAVETHLLLADGLGDAALRDQLGGVIELGHPGYVTSRTETHRRAVTMANSIAGRYPTGLRVGRRARELLRRELAARHDAFDLVVVINPELAPVLPANRSGASAIEFMHLLSIMNDQQTATTGGRRRWLHEADARKARRLEQWAATTYDVVITCSDADRAALQRGGAPSVIVAPNGVNLDRFPVSPVPREPRLVLPGTLDFVPNIDGARWFCDEVLPRIREQRPDAVLDIVGRRPSAEVQALARRPGVSLHADVASVVPYLECARVVVVPLRIGSGTRLKALEAMAAARPVLGTTIGLDGLDLVDGVHAHVADDPGAMAAAAVRLLDDDELAGTAARRGRQLVEDRYSWDSIGASYVEDLLTQVTAPVAPRSA